MSYLKFVPEGTSKSGLTKRWTVQNLEGCVLGWIQWKASWRRYWFEPTNQTGFDAACLKDIVDFLVKETLAQKNIG